MLSPGRGPGGIREGGVTVSVTACRGGACADPLTARRDLLSRCLPRHAAGLWPRCTGDWATGTQDAWFFSSPPEDASPSASSTPSSVHPSKYPRSRPERPHLVVKRNNTGDYRASWGVLALASRDPAPAAWLPRDPGPPLQLLIRKVRGWGGSRAYVHAARSRREVRARRFRRGPSGSGIIIDTWTG